MRRAQNRLACAVLGPVRSQDRLPDVRLPVLAFILLWLAEHWHADQAGARPAAQRPRRCRHAVHAAHGPWADLPPAPNPLLRSAPLPLKVDGFSMGAVMGYSEQHTALLLAADEDIQVFLKVREARDLHPTPAKQFSWGRVCRPAPPCQPQLSSPAPPPPATPPGALAACSCLQSNAHAFTACVPAYDYSTVHESIIHETLSPSSLHSPTMPHCPQDKRSMKLGLDFGLGVGKKLNQNKTVDTQSVQKDEGGDAKTRSFTLSK